MYPTEAMITGKAPVSPAAITIFVALAGLGTAKLVEFFIKWGREEGGLASQSTDGVIPAPGMLHVTYVTYYVYLLHSSVMP